MPIKAIFGCFLEVVNVGCCGFGCSGNWMLWSWMFWYLFSFGCCGFGFYDFGCYDFGRCEYSLWRRFWTFLGGYERWMLRFWMLRKLDATLLDASILTLSGACLPSFGQFFLQIFGNCKNLIVCDGLVYWETCPEIWPKSFKKQRSYDNFKHLVKKQRILFLAPWTQNFRIFRIFENGSCNLRSGKSNGVYAIEIGLTVLEISRSGRIGPPHQLTSSRKPTSNRVKCVLLSGLHLHALRANCEVDPTGSKLLHHSFRLHERNASVLKLLLYLN